MNWLSQCWPLIALFNLQGEVIDINSQIYSRSGSYVGLSFAIPIDVARDVEEQLIRTGHAVNDAEEAPRLGLAVWPLTAEEREALATDGTLVVAEAAGPAAAAGIEVGDIILTVNGRPVRSAAELRRAVEHAGKVVALLIQREAAQIVVPIPIGDTRSR